MKKQNEGEQYLPKLWHTHMSKSSESHECPICKEFKNAKKMIQIPVYGVGQIPGQSTPSRYAEIWEDTLLFEFINIRKSKWLVEDAEGWFTPEGAETEKAFNEKFINCK